VLREKGNGRLVDLQRAAHSLLTTDSDAQKLQEYWEQEFPNLSGNEEAGPLRPFAVSIKISVAYNLADAYSATQRYRNLPPYPLHNSVPAIPD
jgi:hypothetical protein